MSRGPGGGSGRGSVVGVKICGITCEQDALLAAALGADAVGFVFAPSPRQVFPSDVADIVKRLPHGILTVGVFRNDTPEHVALIVNQIGLGAAQLHGDETPDACRYVAERVPLTIKALPAGDPGITRFADYGADLLLVDGPEPGSGKVFDWKLVEGVVDHSRLVVSGGLTPGNVGLAIEHLRPGWVDTSSGVEREPGRKDPVKLRAFIQAAKRAYEEAESARRDVNGEGSLAPYDWAELD